MNYPLISEYIEAIKSAEDNFAELSYLRPVLGNDGMPVMSVGNFAVVFKMKDEQSGNSYALKCFTKEQEGREEAYREIAKELENVSSPYLVSIRYLDKELFVDTGQTSETEFPVLLMDWVEGKTLDKYLRENLVDKYALEMLAYRFSQLAQWLIPQSFAHGDLKPDNILVRKDGTLVLVDYDGMYVSAMKGQKARELGSPDFRHPLRTEHDFNEYIDDFAIATILFSLNNISKNPSLLEKFGAKDRLLLSKNDYYDLDGAKVIQYIYYADEFIDMNYFILKMTLEDHYFKNVDLSWFRQLNKSLEPRIYTFPPKIKIVFNGASFNMIYVKGGSFMMGAQSKSTRMQNYDYEASSEYPFAYGVGDDEGPVKDVEIDGFWISESLVTMDVWPWFQDNPDGIYPYNMRERSEYDNLYAVYGNTYEECKTFMRTLSKETNIKFDFPTEAEWEYAARGGINTNGYKYSGSDTLDEVGVYGKDYNEHGIPLYRVKTKKPNELGIYDMSGGLYEWCKNIPSEQKDEKSQLKKYHIRGGCMNSRSRNCRVSYRGVFYDKNYYEREPFWWQVGLRLTSRDIEPSLDGICITSLSGYATEDEVREAVTDDFGAKYSKDGFKIISIPKETKTYKIRKGVKVICHDAFNSSQIENIVMPDSLLLIGAQAFWGCKSLKEINIPNKVYRIGTQAFWGCSRLERIAIPDSVNYIDPMAFGGCDMLTTCILPSNLDILEEDLFGFCGSLTNITLPVKLESINRNVFWNCNNLQSLILPKHLVEIKENPFRSSGITEIRCDTASFIFENSLLMSADRKELIACLTKKKYVSVPSSIETIKSHAFNGCSSIEQIFLPEGLTVIEDYAFSECESLTALVVPYSVKKVCRGFLSECPKLKQLIIHSKDIWIDDNSTLYKTNGLTQIIIPKETKESFNKKFAKFSNIVEVY